MGPTSNGRGRGEKGTAMGKERGGKEERRKGRKRGRGP